MISGCPRHEAPNHAVYLALVHGRYSSRKGSLMAVVGAGLLWLSDSVWASTGMARDRSSMVATSAAITLFFTSDPFFVFVIIKVAEASRVLPGSRDRSC